MEGCNVTAMDQDKKTKVGPPEECQACVDSGHCINGLYCFYLRKYVEPDATAMCDR